MKNKRLMSFLLNNQEIKYSNRKFHSKMKTLFLNLNLKIRENKKNLKKLQTPYKKTKK